MHGVFELLAPLFVLQQLVARWDPRGRRLGYRETEVGILGQDACHKENSKTGMEKVVSDETVLHIVRQLNKRLDW